MRRLSIPALALIATLLAGCEESDKPPPATVLPAIPADIRSCFARSGAVIPDREMTVGEVETLWKQDRAFGRAMKRCGKRLIAWYDDLRARWK